MIKEVQKEAYIQPLASLLNEFSSHPDTGLAPDQVLRNQETYGKNIGASAKRVGIFTIFIRQLKSLILHILLFSGLFSYLRGQYLEAYVILGIVVLLVIIGFLMEYKATRDMEALSALAPRYARVIRNGVSTKVLSAEVVVGDILLLERGDVVSADARLVSATDLHVDESTLTGESQAVIKRAKDIAHEVPLAEQENMIFSSSQIMSGKGVALVVRVGTQTQVGQIANMLSTLQTQDSPLTRRLDKLSKQVSLVVLNICLLLMLVGMLRGESIDTLILLAVAVGVSGIPESLPIVINIALARGMRRMASAHCVIKRLAAVETLGTCTVICTDKTGTLTQNRMVMQGLWTPSRSLLVTGVGYDPQGEYFCEEKSVDPLSFPDTKQVLTSALGCTNAQLTQKDGSWIVDGESTEGAIVCACLKAGQLYAPKRVFEHAFDPDRKLMSTVHEENGKQVVYVKGAPEYMLKLSTHVLVGKKVVKMTKALAEKISHAQLTYAKDGLRTIGVAYKPYASKNYAIEAVESRLIFAGLLALRDPPATGVLESIAQCKQAGARVVMITGDNKVTASAIAAELGILHATSLILTGSELDALSQPEFLRIVDSVHVYARATPLHKLRIVEALQAKGHAVAMTGDGVNDAPALKKADIGVAMGMRGTQVAREAADMVLTDDNFSSIVRGIEEGRNIYANIRKFVYFLISVSMAQVLLVFVCMLLQFPLILTAIMIIFVNMVTCDIGALALTYEKPSGSLMRQRPRDSNESIVNEQLFYAITQIIPVVMFSVLAMFIWKYWVIGADLVYAQTFAFATIAVMSLAHTYNARSFHRSLFSQFFTNWQLHVGNLVSLLSLLAVIYIPSMQVLFHTTALASIDWLLIFSASCALLVFVELQKAFFAAEKKLAATLEVKPEAHE